MNIRILVFSLMLFCGIKICMASPAVADSLIVVSGYVVDKAHGKKLAGVNLSVLGGSIATVANDDGFFSLKVPRGLLKSGIKAEQVGFKSVIISSIPSVGYDRLKIAMEPQNIQLSELTVYGAEPRTLITRALKKIPQNYPGTPNMFSSFYRETIQKGKRYIDVSEAFVNVLKKPYHTRYIGADRVRLVKGRRLVSNRANDTISVKIVGGPNLPVMLDVVKNPDILFDETEIDYYEYRMEPMALIDDRMQYVVSFKPKVEVDYALNIGKVYIDLETLSFTRAEFSLDVSNKDKATKAILFKKPRGLRFKPQEVDFLVTYKYLDGISYLSYIRTTTRFKCDWKRRLFSSSYTAYAEMVMVERDDNSANTISRKEAFGQHDIFDDMVDNFNDADFWKDYNIIEPTESLEKAVAKLKKK